jgi:hypothetical protein
MTAVRDMLAEIRGVTPPADFYDQKKADRLAQRAAQAGGPAPTSGSASPQTPDR